VNQNLHIDGTVPRLALRSKDAAFALGISERQLWQKTEEGEIPVVKIGGCKVYPVDALRQYLAQQLQPSICNSSEAGGINKAGCSE